MSHDDRKFRPWYTPDTARWLRLSLAARGLIAELLRKWDDRGEIRADDAEDVAILLRLDVADVSRALDECLAAGRLTWDRGAGILRDPDFLARQRRSSADRMRDKRRREREARNGCDARDDRDVTDKSCDGGDAPSPLLSSDLISSEGERERETPPAADPAPTSADPSPPWFGAVVETVSQTTGEQLRPPECWLRYAGHRAEKGKRPSANDARYWLTTVMVPEAREERRRANRDAERDRSRGGAGPPAKPPPKLSPEDTKRFADELRRQVAATEAKAVGHGR